MTMSENQEITLVEQATQAMHGMFEQNTDLIKLASQMAEFSDSFLAAYDMVSDPGHERLMGRSRDLFSFIKNDCQHPTDMDGYFTMLTVFLRHIPICMKTMLDIGYDVFSTKFDFVDPALREPVLKAIVSNIINFKVLERYHEKICEEERPRFSNHLTHQKNDGENHLTEVLYWIAESESDQVFELLGAPLYAHIYALRNTSPAFNPAAIAIDTAMRHMTGGQRTRDITEKFTVQSPTKDWLIGHQSEVEDSVMAGSWSIKYHCRYTAKLVSAAPELKDLANALTLRSRDNPPDLLIDLRKNHGLVPDRECLDILLGKYSQKPWSPAEGDLESLMVYSLVYGNVMGSQWNAPGPVNPVEVLAGAIKEMELRKLAVDPVALSEIAERALSLLTPNHQVGWIADCEPLKPFLKSNRRFQVMRLEEGMGL